MTATTTGFAGNPSVSLTTTAANALVTATLSRFGTADANTNRSAIFNDSITSTLGAASYQIAAGSGSYSDTYTVSLGGSADWSMIMAAFRPAATGTGATTTYIVHTDHLGGTNVVTDNNGELEQALDYFPFGSLRINGKSGAFDEKRKFTGHEYDSEVALNYMMARYQDPKRGQFLSQDPAARDNPNKFLRDPQQLNTYSYARNNPLRNTDPNGEQVTEQGRLTLIAIYSILSVIYTILTSPQFRQDIYRGTQELVRSASSPFNGGSSGSVSINTQTSIVNPPSTSGVTVFGGSQTAVSTPVTTSSITIPQNQVGTFSYPYINFSKSEAIQGTLKPNDAPTGTKPIDSVGLPREVIHEVKEGIGARPNDWTGVTPKGDVITGTRDGKALNHGPIDDYTNRPTGLVR